jgi:hypothetical protein
MIVAGNCPENRGLYLRPAAHHLSVAEPQYPVTAGGEPSIAPSISLELVRVTVILPAIDLDYESRSDEQVDSTDTTDLHLRPSVDSELLQPKSGEGFRDRFGSGIHLGEQPPESSRQFRNQGGPLRERDAP